MSSEEFQVLEEQAAEKNAWQCCQHVCDRVDESPGPHGYMAAHVTPRPGQLLYFNPSSCDIYCI